MRHFILIVLISLVCFSFTACHYSHVKDQEEKTIPVENFDKIYVKGSFNILLEQRNEPSLEIKGLKETIESVMVERDSITGWLELSREKFSMSSPDLVIGFKNLESIRIEGGANIRTDGFLDLQDIDIRVEGGAKMKLKMKARNIRLRGEGGVVYELEGVSKRLHAELYGVAYLNASTLETDTADVVIEGVGIASLKVNELLKARMEGMGKITYVGDPEVDQDIQGLGKISRD